LLTKKKRSAGGLEEKKENGADCTQKWGRTLRN